MNGGCTLVIDPQGAIRYSIYKRFDGDARAERQQAAITGPLARFWVMRQGSGRVLFQETDITGLPQHRVCRLGIAKSYQITNIFPHLSVLENVRVAVQGYARSFNFWSRADRIAAHGCTNEP